MFLLILSKEERKDVVNTRTSGTTPLVMACRNGYFEIVTFLVMHCKADIEITGSGKPEIIVFLTYIINFIFQSILATSFL